MGDTTQQSFGSIASIRAEGHDPGSDRHQPPAHERIVLACAPKSGSTFIARILERYFDIPFGNASLEIDWSAEQNLTPDVERQIAHRSFVLQLHLLPREINLNALTRLDGRTVFSWRNLGDVIVSYDDHLRNDDYHFPTFYVHDRQHYLAMPAQDRYAFLIRYALPWYFAFYLGWRARGVVFRPYDAMIADPHAYFSAMIADITKSPVESDRLTAVLDDPGDGTRLNVGVGGRSNELFSAETKRLLEFVVRSHPEHDRLEVLLHELPWTPPDLTNRSEYDGRLLRAAGSDPIYFINRGRRHYVATPGWVLSRWPGRAIEDVEPAVLDGFDEGDQLT